MMSVTAPEPTVRPFPPGYAVREPFLSNLRGRNQFARAKVLLRKTLVRAFGPPHFVGPQVAVLLQKKAAAFAAAF